MTLAKRLRFSFSRFLATATLLLMLLAAYDINQKLRSLGVLFSLRSFWWQVVIFAFIFAIFGLFFIWFGRFDKVVYKFTSYFKNHWLSNPAILLGLFIIISFGYPIWVLKIGHIVLNGYRTYLFFFLLVSILGMFCLRPVTPEGNWKIALVGSMLISAVIFKALIYAFQGISPSPFSLSWSEGSRYYYGSLFFSERLYGIDIPPSPLHPSRYLLLAFPFVFSGLPIWVHRTWQVLLWIVMAVLAGITLSKRLKIRNRALLIFFSAWVYLFLNLGPVYYHLLICVILIYLGVDFDKPGQTLGSLLLASIWAGLSRINWVPVPMFLVLTLYFFERPWNLSKIGWRYLRQPVLWGVGILTAFSAYALYIPLSGNQPGKFRSTFTSDLLWNRLWPNPTYPLGIFWGAILVTVPLWLVIVATYRQRDTKVHPFKLIGITLIAIVLFLGGLLVSVKIGGGSNLHNLDAYFVLMMTIASYMFWGSAGEGQSSIEQHLKLPIPQWIPALAILIPVMLIIREWGVVSTPDLKKDQQDLHTLQELILDVSEADGDILFISERQLQVFSMIPKVQFIPDYEKIELMEMAMAGNQAYIAQFYKDITFQRFDLIITDSVRMDLKDEIDAFSEEHNVWVGTVLTPLLDHYDFTALGGRRNIFTLTPKP